MTQLSHGLIWMFSSVPTFPGHLTLALSAGGSWFLWPVIICKLYVLNTSISFHNRLGLRLAHNVGLVIPSLFMEANTLLKRWAVYGKLHWTSPWLFLKCFCAMPNTKIVYASLYSNYPKGPNILSYKGYYFYDFLFDLIHTIPLLKKN